VLLAPRFFLLLLAYSAASFWFISACFLRPRDLGIQQVC